MAILAGMGVSGGGEVVLPDRVPALRGPVLLTTCGQTGAAENVGSNLRDVGITCFRRDAVYAGELAADCPPDAETYFAEVLFVTGGGCWEGPSAAATDAGLDVRRCVALIERAKELGMVVVVGRIEACPPLSRDSQEFEEGIASLADLLIAHADVNADGRFTALSEERDIPLVVIDEPGELLSLFLLLFPPADSVEETPPTC